MGLIGSRKRWISAVLVVILAVIVWNWAFPRFPRPSGSTWQAVFLSNDQVYFGKLRSYSREYAILEKIFYLRVAQPLQQGAASQPALNLIKLGGELHGPQDKMFVPKDKILFWEDLRADSQVVQAINNFLSQQK